MTEERLTEMGFKFVGTCHCHGAPNKKYKRGEFLVYIKNSQFKVKKFGTTIKGYTNIEGLEAYLQKAIPGLLVGE